MGNPFLKEKLEVAQNEGIVKSRRLGYDFWHGTDERFASERFV